jgi:hypothetical protein
MGMQDVPEEGNLLMPVDMIASLLLAAGSTKTIEAEGKVSIDPASISSGFLDALNTVLKPKARLQKAQVGWILMADEKGRVFVFGPMKINIDSRLSFYQLMKRLIDIMA